jgi:hypothetical protein
MWIRWILIRIRNTAFLDQTRINNIFFTCFQLNCAEHGDDNRLTEEHLENLTTCKGSYCIKT